MAPRSTPQAAAIGFRVKTARATAVLLEGPVTAPKLIARRAVELWDAEVPASRPRYVVSDIRETGCSAPRSTVRVVVAVWLPSEGRETSAVAPR